MKINKSLSKLYRVSVCLITCLCICVSLAGCDIGALLGFEPRNPNQTDPSQSQTTPPNFGAETISPLETTAPETTAPEATEDMQPNVVKYGIVVTDNLTVRSKASSDADTVGTLTYGSRITVYKEENDWAEINGGWVKKDSIYIFGDVGANYVGKCTVTTNGVNVRSGPSTDDQIVGSVNIGNQTEVLEQVRVGDLWWGCTANGWICMDYLYTDGTRTDDYGYGTLTADHVNIRKGPGTGFAAVGAYSKGDQVEIFKVMTVSGMRWGCTDKGWVCMDYVEYSPLSS